MCKKLNISDVNFKTKHYYCFTLQDYCCIRKQFLKINYEGKKNDHDHETDEQSGWISQWPLLMALLILVIMLTLRYGFNLKWNYLLELVVYVIAYLLAGYNVIGLAFRKAIRFDFFNEFFLMTVATIGAFAIGSYSEGVAVMVFYSIGEWFQDAAVANAKRNIKALLDIRPDTVTVVREGKTLSTHPSQVKINEIIQIKPGEKVALDGILISMKGTFNTAAITGESMPDTKVKGNLVMDKTGTLTKGVFNVQKVVPHLLPKEEFLLLVAALESKSTHPIAVAITKYAGKFIPGVKISAVEELAGHGLKGIINGKAVLVGNASLFQKLHIKYDHAVDAEVDTVVLVAVDQQLAGYLTIADEVKADTAKTITALHKMNISTMMLSGDKEIVVAMVARLLGVGEAYGALLPEDKVQKVTALKAMGKRIAFVGDGVNDAPVIALADVGIAMGGMGSDATIETADVVIQNDQPFKIVTAIKVARLTKNVVWQNIALAMGVKILVLLLGAGGVATLWEAVIADVGVALLAILNAVRIQKMKL